MSDAQQPVILCISTYEKGQAFLREVARSGVGVMLLTVEKLKDANWPKDILSEFFTMPEDLPLPQVITTVSYIARHHRIDRIVALDEFDMEMAAALREHLRLPGMGASTTAYFRDKLAMRIRAQRAGIAVPEFTPVFNYEDLRDFMEAVPGPWLLKPRTGASAIGIKRVEKAEHVWRMLDELGDEQSNYLLERFIPGEIFHVDGVSWNRQVLFAAIHQYGTPPMQTMHEGGVFTTRTIHRDSRDSRMLEVLHETLVPTLGLVAGVTHTEFIRSDADGRFYFLETAARVGGAFIAELVEFATGINPWIEWARIEVAALREEQYELPRTQDNYAGSILCLAKQPEPDTSMFDDPEIVFRMSKHHHAGLIVLSESAERVRLLLEDYAPQFLDRFCAVEPVPDKPTA